MRSDEDVGEGVGNEKRFASGMRMPVEKEVVGPPDKGGNSFCCC